MESGNGTIEVKSDGLGHGSTFSFTMKMIKAPVIETHIEQEEVLSEESGVSLDKILENEQMSSSSLIHSMNTSER